MPEERIIEKLPYVTPEMDITIFSGEDVIATSGAALDEDDLPTDNHGWIQRFGHNMKENGNYCPPT